MERNNMSYIIDDSYVITGKATDCLPRIKNRISNLANHCHGASLQRYPILCLTISKQTTPVATDTFNESMSPGMGIIRWPSRRLR